MKGRQERKKEGKQMKRKEEEMKEVWREGGRKEREWEGGREGRRKRIFSLNRRGGCLGLTEGNKRRN